MEKSVKLNIFQMVVEQGYLLHQHHDQLAQLGTAMEEVRRSVQRLEHAREALSSTSGGCSKTS
jgi:hypothetical protein